VKSTFYWAVTVLSLSLTVTIITAKGSGVGIYALIDQVDFDQGGPLSKTVQISGVFVIPVPMSSGAYQAPQRGYLYFWIPSDREQAARNELDQLRTVAGTRQVVGFAFYWVPNPNDPGGNPHHSLEVRVRRTGEGAAPDVYPIRYPKGVVRAGDENFDAAIAAKLRNFPN
jgi:hypothetical protein